MDQVISDRAIYICRFFYSETRSFGRSVLPENMEFGMWKYETFIANLSNSLFIDA